MGFGWVVNLLVYITLWETGAELQLPIERVVYSNLQTYEPISLPMLPTLYLTVWHMVVNSEFSMY